MVIVEIFDLKMAFFDPRMIFFALLVTLNDHYIHAIRIKIEFGIESYAYHVHLAIFSIFDLKMTIFDP